MTDTEFDIVLNDIRHDRLDSLIASTPDPFGDSPAENSKAPGASGAADGQGVSTFDCPASWMERLKSESSVDGHISRSPSAVRGRYVLTYQFEGKPGVTVPVGLAFACKALIVLLNQGVDSVTVVVA